MDGPPARLIDSVRGIAAAQPGRLALVADGRLVTYAAFHAGLCRMAHLLATFVLPPGSLVAVAHPNVHVHLLITGALEALGLINGSFHDDEGLGCHPLLAAADLVLSETPPSGPCRRHVAITPDWLAPVLDDTTPVPPLPPTPQPRDDDCVLLIRSSGTTGRQKRMLLTRSMVAARLSQRILSYGMSAGSRYLATMYFSVHGVHVTAMLALRLGGVAMADTRLALPLAMQAYQPTHATMMPHQLATLLDCLPADYVRLPQLTLLVMGARLPPTVRQAALARLCGRIVDHYGANEAGMIAILEDGIAAPMPGILTNVVDESGSVLPTGRVGRLRVSGPSVTRAYCADPDATARHFPDGWFEPGDEAIALPDGRFRLTGRFGDVLNLGGYKVACADVEASLRLLPAVRDAAIVPAADDVPAHCVIAVVLDPGVPMEQAHAAIIADLPDELRSAPIRAIAAIPRTPEGKIRRYALREMVADEAATELGSTGAA